MNTCGWNEIGLITPPYCPRCLWQTEKKNGKERLEEEGGKAKKNRKWNAEIGRKLKEIMESSMKTTERKWKRTVCLDWCMQGSVYVSFIFLCCHVCCYFLVACFHSLLLLVFLLTPPLIVAFPQIYGSHVPLPSVLAIQTLISRSLSISPSPSCLSLSHSFHLSAAQKD